MKIYIERSATRGRGVYAAVGFEPNEIIEVCPVLVLPPSDTPHLTQTFLYNYYFEWGPEATETAIALGYGSLYNHSYQPNAVYHMDFEEETLTVVCCRPIAPGDEITFSYNGDPDDDSALWFEVL